LLFLLVVAFHIWRPAGARLFAIVYALINAYFAASLYVLAGMAITGDWL
jgi:hypothetical protein